MSYSLFMQPDALICQLCVTPEALQFLHARQRAPPPAAPTWIAMKRWKGGNGVLQMQHGNIGQEQLENKVF